MNPIVSVKWLENHLQDADVIVLDASQKTSVNKQENVIKDQYIPGSIGFDLKKFSDQESTLPNTLPSADWFTQKCQELGINSNSKIVVYDRSGIYWSPRVWWMFQIMGHEQVTVLDGGLPAWIEEGRETVDDLTSSTKSGNFEASLNLNFVKSFEDILANLKENVFLVVDARSEGRFTGSSPEPREGLDSGHIPGSENIPFEEVLQDGYFKSEKQLRKVFGELGHNNQLVFSCGSGLTACIPMLAYHSISSQISPIYDGSWTEWVLRGGSIDKG